MVRPLVAQQALEMVTPRILQLTFPLDTVVGQAGLHERVHGLIELVLHLGEEVGRCRTKSKSSVHAVVKSCGRF
jgi:hypothetical protein